MARFCTLNSGSSGNCTYIGSSGQGLLIDVGINCKTVEATLGSQGIEMESIKGILITHEHNDHIKGLKVLTKKHNITVYSTEKILNALLEKGHIHTGTQVISLETKTTEVFGFGVDYFRTLHDTDDSCGYRIELSNGQKIGIATDLGRITDVVEKGLFGSDLVLIESNYDEKMLDSGPYPYFLKKRIKSDNGHLSNDDCASFVIKQLKTGTTRIVLGHLSGENNMPILAKETTTCELNLSGAVEGIDYELFVAPRLKPSKLMIF